MVATDLLIIDYKFLTFWGLQILGFAYIYSEIFVT